MTDAIEPTLAQRFLVAAADGALPKGGTLTVRLPAGTGHSHAVDEFEIQSGGRVSLRRAPAPDQPYVEYYAEPPIVEDRLLLLTFARNLDGLVPRSKARFVPESAVGSVVVELDGRRESYYFLPDPVDREIQNYPIQPAFERAIASLKAMRSAATHHGEQDARR